MDTVTYTKRTNARRAALRTGLTSDRIEITVHKLHGEVRFGWRQIDLPVITTGIKRLPFSTDVREIGCGRKRPGSGTKCFVIWDWLDKNPNATLSDARLAADKFGWNINTVTRQFYLQRRHGVSESGC